jgi:Nucleotidyltransferase domain
MLDRLLPQLPRASADELSSVLQVLAGEAAGILGEDLLGVYLTGSFALGAGDAHSDVDFLVVARSEPTPEQEARARALHRSLPDRHERWAGRLEGSWVSSAALRDPPGAHDPWLYVDNGHREMERSRHDDSANGRWVLREGGLAVVGPPPASLLDAVSPDAVRAEARDQADLRSVWLREHPESLDDGWMQPYAVLTSCRLVYAAEYGRVGAKAASTEWVRDSVAPGRFRDLLTDAIAHRAAPFGGTGGRSDPARAAATPEFVEWALGEVHGRATRPIN